MRSLWFQRPHLEPAKMALDHSLPDVFVIVEVRFLAGPKVQELNSKRFFYVHNINLRTPKVKAKMHQVACKLDLC